MEINFEILATNLNKTILTIITIILVLIGLTLNTLAIFVFLRPRFKQNPMGIYKVVMNINYNAIAILNTLIYFPMSLGTNLTLWSNFSCFFLYYSSRVLTTFASWLILIACLDMLLKVIFPKKKIISKKGLLLTIAFTLISLIFIHLPNAYLHVQTTRSFLNSTNLTIISKRCLADSVDMNTVIDLTRLLIRLFVPFTLIIIIDSLLIYKLIKAKYSSRNNDLDDEFKFAVSILVLSLVFIASLLPFVVTFAISRIYTQLDYILSFTYLISLVSFATSFFFFQFLIYFKFNNMFREELNIMLNSFKMRILTGFQFNLK